MINQQPVKWSLAPSWFPSNPISDEFPKTSIEKYGWTSYKSWPYPYQGTIVYPRMPQGYFDERMHLDGKQNPMLFNALETTNAPLHSEFHPYLSSQRMCFNEFAIELHQWHAPPSLYEPNYGVINLQTLSAYPPWSLSRQDSFGPHAQYVDLAPSLHHTRYGYFLDTMWVHGPSNQSHNPFSPRPSISQSSNPLRRHAMS
ncbi:hypothetical protein Cgig2_013293 [Carnegiea gigantea]|uniref:Uncharacterized protein n=1 Tax=Carnegiea gigantea TaxID=171969 RepID=A0A9Q1GJX9_9CARY|nr:hypothetical protein Cgig2_013293 [Carnegiea gigantea]